MNTKICMFLQVQDNIIACVAILTEYIASGHKGETICQAQNLKWLCIQKIQLYKS